MPIILGLDVSTSCTGICVVDDNIEPDNKGSHILFLKAIELAKFKTLERKEEEIQNFFHNQFLIDVDRIVVEEPLTAFRPGMSSAQTISTLVRFNGIVSEVARWEVGRRTYEWVPSGLAMHFGWKSWSNVEILLQFLGHKPYELGQMWHGSRSYFDRGSELREFPGAVLVRNRDVRTQHEYMPHNAFTITICEPEYIGSAHARKLCGIKLQRTALGGPQKEQVFSYMAVNDLKHVVWPLKKSGKVVDWSRDATDAYVIARAAAVNGPVQPAPKKPRKAKA